MIKLTRSALTMLLAHYRAIYKNAYVRGVAAAAMAAALGLGAQVAQAAADVHSAWEATEDKTTASISAGSDAFTTSSNVAAASVLTVSASDTLKITSAVSISSGAQKAGLTVASGGAVSASVAVALKTVTVSEGGKLTLLKEAAKVGGSESLTIDGTVSGAAKSAVTLSGGAVTVGSAGKVQGTSANVVLKSTSGAVTIDGTIAVNAKGTIAVTASSGLTVNGKVTGASAVTLKATTKDVTLGSSVTLSGKTISAVATAGKLTYGSLTLAANDGLTLKSKSGISGGAITVGTADAPKVVNITAETTGKGDINLSSVTTSGTVTVTAASGNVTVGSVTGHGAIQLKSTSSGSVTLSGTLTQTSGGAGVSAIASSGSVLGGGNITSNSGEVTVKALKAITLGEITVTSGDALGKKDVSVTTTGVGGVISLSKISTSGKVTVTAAKAGAKVTGDITAFGAVLVKSADSGNVTLGGTIKQTSGGAKVSAIASSGSVLGGGNIINNSGDVIISALNAITVGNISVNSGTSEGAGKGAVSVTTTKKGDIVVGTVKTGKTVTVTAASGSVEIGAVTAASAIAIKSSSSGDVTLKGAIEQTTKGKTVSISALAGKIAGGSNITNASGTVSLGAATGITVGNISVVSGAAAIGSGAVTATNTGLGDISIGDITTKHNVTVDAKSGSVTLKAVTGSAVTIKAEENGSITLGGAVTTTAALSAIASGDLKATGAISIGADSVLTAAGTLTLGTVSGGSHKLSLSNGEGETSLTGLTGVAGLDLDSTGAGTYTIANLGSGTGVTGTVNVGSSTATTLAVTSKLVLDASNKVVVSNDSTLDATGATISLDSGNVLTVTAGTAILDADKVLTLTTKTSDDGAAVASAAAYLNTSNVADDATISVGASGVIRLTGTAYSGDVLYYTDEATDSGASAAANTAGYTTLGQLLAAIDADAANGAELLIDGVTLKKYGSDGSTSNAVLSDEVSSMGNVDSVQTNTAGVSQTTAGKNDVTLDTDVTEGSVTLATADTAKVTDATEAATATKTLELTGQAGTETLYLVDADTDNGNFVSTRSGSTADVTLNNVTLSLNGEGSIGNVTNAAADGTTPGTLEVNTSDALADEEKAGTTVTIASVGTAAVTAADGTVTTPAKHLEVEVGTGTAAVTGDAYVSDLTLSNTTSDDHAVFTAANAEVVGNIESKTDSVVDNGEVNIAGTLTIGDSTGASASTITATDLTASTLSLAAAADGTTAATVVLADSTEGVATVVTANQLLLNGGTLVVDPSIAYFGTTAASSTASSTATAELNGLVAVGTDSGVYFGGTSSNMDSYIVQDSTTLATTLKEVALDVGALTVTAGVTVDGAAVPTPETVLTATPTPAAATNQAVAYVNANLLLTEDVGGLWLEGDEGTAATLAGAAQANQIRVTDGGLLVVSSDITFGSDAGVVDLSQKDASAGKLLFVGTNDATPSITAQTFTLTGATVAVKSDVTATLKGTNATASAFTAADTNYLIEEDGTLVLDNSTAKGTAATDTVTSSEIGTTTGTNYIAGTLQLNGVFNLTTNDLTNNQKEPVADSVPGADTVLINAGTLSLTKGSTLTNNKSISGFYEAEINGTLDLNAASSALDVEVLSGSGDITVDATAVTATPATITAGVWNYSGDITTEDAASVLTIANDSLGQQFDLSSTDFENNGTVTLSATNTTTRGTFKLSDAQLDSTKTAARGSLINTDGGILVISTNNTTVYGTNANLVNATATNLNGWGVLDVTTATIDGAGNGWVSPVTLHTDELKAKGKQTNGAILNSGANVTVRKTLSTALDVQNAWVVLGEAGSSFSGGNNDILITAAGASTGQVNIYGNASDIGDVSFASTGVLSVIGNVTMDSLDTTNGGNATFGGTVNGTAIGSTSTVKKVTGAAAGTIALTNESDVTFTTGSTTLDAGSVTLSGASTLTIGYSDFTTGFTASGAVQQATTPKIALDFASADADSTVVLNYSSDTAKKLSATEYNALRNAVFSSVTADDATGTGLISVQGANISYDTASLDTDENGTIEYDEAMTVNGDFAKGADVIDIDATNAAPLTGTRTWNSATLAENVDTLYIGTAGTDGSLELLRQSDGSAISDASTPYVAQSDGTAADVVLGGAASEGSLHVLGSGTLGDVTFNAGGGELSFGDADAANDSSATQYTAKVNSLGGTAGVGDLVLIHTDLTVTEGGADLDQVAMNYASVTLGSGESFKNDNGTNSWVADSTISADEIDLTAGGGVWRSSLTAAAGNVSVTGEADSSNLSAASGDVTVAGTANANTITSGGDVSITTGAITDNKVTAGSTGAATLTGADARNVSGNTVTAQDIALTAGATAAAGTANNEVKNNTLTATKTAAFQVGNGSYDAASDTVVYSPVVSGNKVSAPDVTYTLGNYVTAENETVTASEQFTVDLGVPGTGTVKNSTFTAQAASTDTTEYVSKIEGELTSGNRVDTSRQTLQLTDDTYVLGGSTLATQVLDLNGNGLLLDPAWTEGASYAYANELDNDNELDGDVVVGQNSAIYVGTNLSEAAFQSYLADNLSSDDYTALAYVDAPLTIAAGGYGLTVDGSLDDTDDLDTAQAAVNDTVTVAADSALIIGAGAFENTQDDDGNYGLDATDAAITFSSGNGTVTLANGSAVELKGLNTYTTEQINLFDGAATITNSGALVATANSLYRGTLDTDTGVVTLRYDDDLASAALEKTDDSIAGPIKDYAQNVAVDKDHQILASSFVNHALELGDPDKIGKSLNSAARIAVLGGATQNAQLAHRAYTDALEERQGFIAKTSSSIGQVQGTDVTVWVTPLYVTQDSDGYDGGKSGDLGVDGKLWGVTLGIDGTLDNGLTVGGAFHVGSGDSDHNGSGYEKTDGDFDFWGLSLYGAYTYEGFKFLGDISYTAVDNDIDQDNAAGHLQADIDSKLLSVGLQGKYDFDVDGITITPHIGLRYHHLDVDSYTVNFRGGDNFDGKSFDANYVTFPIGIGVSKDILTSGGWTVKPAADFSIIPVAGDKDVKSKIVSNNIEMSATSDITDDVLFRLRLGVDAQYRNFGLGFGYGYLGGSDTKSHNLSATLRYTF